MPLRDFLFRFQRALPQPFVSGNRVTLLVDGGAYFSNLLDALRNATRTAFLETYIFEADQTGRRVSDALLDCAKRGVEVAVMYDGYGSISLDPSLPERLRRGGVKLLAFRPLSILRGVWPWTKRNHRKSLIVDSRIGIVGGQNISDDYAPREDGGRGWRDTAVRVEGPAVVQLEAMFRRTWTLYGGEPLVTHSVAPPSFPEGHQVRFLGNFARRDRAFIRRSYLLAILGAEKSIRICNAYFVPDRVFTRALIRAARRGVRVEVIVGAATDVLAALHLARGLYTKLLRSGVQVYEWHGRILHAKTAVIDGDWSTVGSSNLDNLSLFRNLEVNAGILGEGIAREMEEQFEIDAARSTKIELDAWSKRPIVQRLIEWFFGLFRGLFSRSPH